jgi:hypothetical protein
MSQPISTPELDERRAAQQKEYGQYTAKEDIYVGTALAYRKGDPVPASNVEQHGYADDGLVERVKGAGGTSSSAAGTKTATTSTTKKESN